MAGYLSNLYKLLNASIKVSRKNFGKLQVSHFYKLLHVLIQIWG